MEERLTRRLPSLRRVLVGLGADPEALEATPIHGGRSGAWTYRLDVEGRRFALRIQPPDRLEEQWRALHLAHRCASDGALAPRVHHVSEPERWMLTDFVEDLSLSIALRDPERGPELLGRLGQRVAQVHRLIPPTGLATRDAARHGEILLAQADEWGTLSKLARRVRDDFQRRAPPPPPAACLVHHDLNPTNLAFDGREIWILDWETAGRGTPWFDLATLINFLLLDAPRTERLVGEYARERKGVGPDESQLRHARRLAYLVYAATFLDLAGPESLEPAAPVLTLPQCYQAMASGVLDLNASAGRRRLAEALFAGYLGI